MLLDDDGESEEAQLEVLDLATSDAAAVRVAVLEAQVKELREERRRGQLEMMGQMAALFANMMGGTPLPQQPVLSAGPAGHLGVPAAPEPPVVPVYEGHMTGGFPAMAVPVPAATTAGGWKPALHMDVSAGLSHAQPAVAPGSLPAAVAGKQPLQAECPPQCFVASPLRHAGYAGPPPGYAGPPPGYVGPPPGYVGPPRATLAHRRASRLPR